MKPMTPLLSIHKTFAKDALKKQDVVLHVSDGKKVKKTVGMPKIVAFIETVKPGTVVRSSSVNSSDLILLALQGQGALITYAHWHELGIDKGLDPEEIALGVARAPEGVFRPFTPNKVLVDLRYALSCRNALLEYYNSCKRSMMMAARNAGDASYENPELLSDIEALGEIRNVFKFNTGSQFKDKATGEMKDKSIAWETRVTQIAEKIPECKLFAGIAGFDSLGTAAAIVAYANGIERFPDVASFWAYCGQGVVDGKAPKRKKGQPANWSPRARTALYNMMESIVKNKNNPWNAQLEAWKQEELAVHAEKHPGCPSPLGHSFMRARRRVTKEILKRFYLAATGNQFVEGHQPAIRML